MVGVDKAQAAVLTYEFLGDRSPVSGFFKLSNSSLTGRGVEEIAVSEGRLYSFINLRDDGGKESGRV